MELLLIDIAGALLAVLSGWFGCLCSFVIGLGVGCGLTMYMKSWG